MSFSLDPTGNPDNAAADYAGLDYDSSQCIFDDIDENSDIHNSDIEEIILELPSQQPLTPLKQTNTSETSDMDISSDDEETIRPQTNHIDEFDETNDGPLLTKNEIKVFKIVPFTDNVPEGPLIHIGTVSAIVGSTVVIEGVDTTEEVLDIDTVLLTSERAVIGRIFDTFGPVIKPFYTILFNNADEIKKTEVKVGINVLTIKPLSKVCLIKNINQKGTDASNLYDEEVTDNEMEFSDDEKEMQFKTKKKGAKRDCTQVQLSEGEISEDDRKFVPPVGKMKNGHSDTSFSKRGTGDSSRGAFRGRKDPRFGNADTVHNSNVPPIGNHLRNSSNYRGRIGNTNYADRNHRNNPSARSAYNPRNPQNHPNNGNLTNVSGMQFPQALNLDPRQLEQMIFMLQKQQQIQQQQVMQQQLQQRQNEQLHQEHLHQQQLHQQQLHQQHFEPSKVSNKRVFKFPASWNGNATTQITQPPSTSYSPISQTSDAEVKKINTLPLFISPMNNISSVAESNQDAMNVNQPYASETFEHAPRYRYSSNQNP
jgi:rRNA processing protein Gar1